MAKHVQNQWIARLKRSAILILLSLPLIPLFLFVPFLRAGWHLGAVFAVYESGVAAFLMRHDFAKNLRRIPRSNTVQRRWFVALAICGAVLIAGGIFLAIQTGPDGFVVPGYWSQLLLVGGLCALGSTEFLARSRRDKNRQTPAEKERSTSPR